MLEGGPQICHRSPPQSPPGLSPRGHWDGRTQMERDLRAKPLHVDPTIPSRQTCSGCISSVRPPAIIHHAATDRARGGGAGEHRLVYLCRSGGGSWNRHGGGGARCIISWLFRAQNTSSALTSSQLIYLIAAELIYRDSLAFCCRYNQVRVYKLQDSTPEVETLAAFGG